MRLLGFGAEKSHFLYLIIYQVFKSVFSIENETLRLFLKKTFSRKKESFCPYRATGLYPSLPRVLPWAKSFCPFYYICTWKNKEVKIFISANFC